MGLKAGITLTSSKDRKLLKQFGLLVRHEREKKRLTLCDVSGEDLDIKSEQHWQTIESGKNINLTTFFKVCKILEVHPSVLLKKFEIN